MLNKNFVILFLFLLMSVSCSTTELSGVWIEKDNYRNPLIIEFKYNTYSENYHNPLYNSLKYKEKRNRIELNTFKRLEEVPCPNGKKAKKLKKKILSIPYSFDGDTLVLKNNFRKKRFQRGKGKHFLDDIEENLSITIDLPETRNNIYTTEGNQNIIFLCNDKNRDETVCIFNGRNIITDSLLTSKTKNELRQSTVNYLIIDKKVKVDKIKELKDLLKDNNQEKIVFVAIGDSTLKYNDLSGLPFIFSLKNKKDNKKINTKLPVKINSDKETDTLIRKEAQTYFNILANSVLLNGKEFDYSLNYIEFGKQISNLKKHIIQYSLNDNACYEDYFRFLDYVYWYYQWERNKYAHQEYGSPFENLNSPQQDEIKRQIPIRLDEL